MQTDRICQGKKRDPLFPSNMKKSFNYLHSHINFQLMHNVINTVIKHVSFICLPIVSFIKRIIKLHVPPSKIQSTQPLLLKQHNICFRDLGVFNVIQTIQAPMMRPRSIIFVLFWHIIQCSVTLCFLQSYTHQISRHCQCQQYRDCWPRHTVAQSRDPLMDSAGVISGTT